MIKDYVKDAIQLIGSGDSKAIQHQIGVITNNLYEDIKLHSEQIKNIEEQLTLYREQIKELDKQLEIIQTLTGRYVKTEKNISQEGPSESKVARLLVQLKEISSRDGRRNIIKEIALELVKEGNKVISVDLIKRNLEKRGIELNIQRAGSAIGTILNSMHEFKRTQMGSFEYIGSSQLEIK